MTRLLRLALALLALALVVPEFARYAAERRLTAANTLLGRVLMQRFEPAEGARLVQAALDDADAAAPALPEDARVALARGVALSLLGRGQEAVRVLDAAIAAGERPELSLCLGRARAVAGDEAGADRAFFRTAWASSFALGTLPKGLREALLARVAEREQAFREGRVDGAPPL